jgi:hypothetical protein
MPILPVVPTKAKSSHPTTKATPQERLERFVKLQRLGWELLIASPCGYRRFWERNLRQRRIHARF